MRSRGLARSRAIIACAVCGAGALAAGCSTTAASSTVTVSGTTLTIYASAPAAADSRAQDVLAAEQLAFSQGESAITHFKLRLDVVRSAKLSNNARSAISNSNTIAYLGEIVPGQSADSMGILEDQDVLQVSPTDTAVELTQGSAAVPGAPKSYYESFSTYGRTFARVVPTSALEAKALVADAGLEHVTKLFVASDGSPYGTALAYAVKRAAVTSSLSVVTGPASARAFSNSGADGALFAGSNQAAAVSLFNAVAAGSPTVTLLAPSALDDVQFVDALTTGAQSALRVSAPGFLPAELSSSGRQFVSSFQSAYHHQPSPEAIFGYEAMQALLSVIQRAGTGASDRTTVQRDFFALRNRTSVLGTYSINADGDTSLAPFVISRVTSGQLTPFRSMSEQG